MFMEQQNLKYTLTVLRKRSENYVQLINLKILASWSNLILDY